MNKGAIIGIGIAIIVVAIAGIYAVTNNLVGSPETPQIGIEDSATGKIVEPEETELPVEEEGVGFEDTAEGQIDEPTNATDSHDITVYEEFGFSDVEP